MEPVLLFYGPWTVEVIGLVVGAGSPVLRLFLDKAGAADGSYLNPPVGTHMEADGSQWILGVDISFDPPPYQAQVLMREYSFDPQRGITATVKASFQSPAVQAEIALRLTANAPELGARPVVPYDFSIPESAHPQKS